MQFVFIHKNIMYICLMHRLNKHENENNPVILLSMCITRGVNKNVLIQKKRFLKTNLILFTISLLTFISTFSQNTYTIKGIVKDQTDSLVFARALLVDMEDSSLIKGSLIKNGVLLLEGIIVDSALLKIESIDIKSKFIPISRPSENELDIGDIKVESGILLDVVNVTALKPAFVLESSGKLKINVKESILESSTSVLDVLSKSPSVIIEDETIIVFGIGEAIIFVNDKLVSSTQLNTIPVSNINFVEIISNPPAIYDARGKAVINIKLIDSPAKGFSGEIVQNTTFAKHLQSYTVLTLNYSKNKLAFQSSYCQNFGRNWLSNRLTRESYSNSDKTISVNNFEDNSNLKYFNTYNLGISYSLNSKNNLSLEYVGSSSITDQDSKAQTIFLDLNNDTTVINTVNYGESNYLSNSINLNYTCTFDSIGSTLLVGGHYFIFDSQNVNHIDELIQTSYNRKNISSSAISFNTTQVDMTKYIKNNKNKLEFGIKLINADNNGIIDFFSKKTDETKFVYSPTQSNDFRYMELIGAAYIQFETEIGKNNNFSLGLRSEYTDAEGYSFALGNYAIDTNYLNIFPALNLGHRFNDNWNANLSFSSSINRPSYQALDPFVFYVDSLTTNQGNPKLRPESGYSLESNIHFKRYTLKIGYTITNNAFRYALLPNGNIQNSATLMQINVEREHSYLATFQVPVVSKRIRSFNIIGVSLDQVDDSRPEFKSRGYFPRFYFFSNNMIDLGNLGKIQVDFKFLGTRYDGIYYRKPACNVALGWTKSFFKNKLNCSFLADDIFHTFIVNGHYELNSSRVSYLRKMNTQLYRVTLVYQFGKMDKPGFSSVGIGSESNNRISK